MLRGGHAYKCGHVKYCGDHVQMVQTGHLCCYCYCWCFDRALTAQGVTGDAKAKSMNAFAEFLELHRHANFNDFRNMY